MYQSDSGNLLGTGRITHNPAQIFRPWTLYKENFLYSFHQNFDKKAKMKLNYLLIGSIAAMKSPTLITATGKTLTLNCFWGKSFLDVIDVLQEECHQAVYEGVPKQSMIKGWRKKFLEKSKNIKKFIELQSCAIFELDSLNPKLTEDPSADTFIQVSFFFIKNAAWIKKLASKHAFIWLV